MKESYCHFSTEFDNQTTEKILVDCFTLDGILADLGNADQRHFFLKIDVQGGEFDVLKGACESLLSHIDVVYFEMQLIEKYEVDYSYNEVLTYLERKGFVMFDMNLTYKELNSVPCQFSREGQLTEMEFIFVRKSLTGIIS